jgi:hypothetical protein
MPCEFDSTMLTTRARCAELAASCSDVAAMLNRVVTSTTGTTGGDGATAAAATGGLTLVKVTAPAELRADVMVAAALIPASTAAESLAASSSLLCFALLLLFVLLLLLLAAPVMMVPLHVTVPTLKSPTGMLSASEYASANVSRYASSLCSKQSGSSDGNDQVGASRQGSISVAW